LLGDQNKNTLITRVLINDWLQNGFAHDIKEYSEKKNLNFKVLLVSNNDPKHNPETL
jgi:hypothetical protein